MAFISYFLGGLSNLSLSDHAPTRSQPSRSARTNTEGTRKQFQRLTFASRKNVNYHIDVYNRGDRGSIVVRTPQSSNLPGRTPLPQEDNPPETCVVALRNFISLVYGVDCQSNWVLLEIAEIYIQNICQHLNGIHGRSQPGTIPLWYTQDGKFSTLFKDFEFDPPEYAEDIPDNYIPAAQRLRQGGITPAVFKNLRHLFLPLNWDNRHAQLLIISPLTKTMQFFCSGIPKIGNREETYAIGCALIESIVSPDDRAGEHWFVPSEWKVRKDRGTRQGQTNNCVIYALSNAQSVAFGYSTDFSGMDFVARRWKVAADLINGGFEPHDGNPESEFYYPCDTKLMVTGSTDWYRYRDCEDFRDLMNERKVAQVLDEKGYHFWHRRSS